jgi:phosphatidate phosphatase LPIN
MKIGEAGEAFFVFETEDDIPEDLITSPLLEATQTAVSGDANVSTKQDKTEGGDIDMQTKVPEEAQEPDFLDLDAAPKEQSSPPSPPPTESPVPEPSGTPPSSPPSPMLFGVTPSSLLGSQLDPQQNVDAYLQSIQSKVHGPDVSYQRGELNSSLSIRTRVIIQGGIDIALDVEGYHTAGPVKEAADKPSVHQENADAEYPVASTSRSPSPSRMPQPSSCVFALPLTLMDINVKCSSQAHQLP